ncbi:MAG TPA: helix-turn-helix domain-containing protein [Acidobacteriaceae bacterium]|nr:helix-turn-helix domain-containing protein [Acidobacteriaceae bacterium]
MTTLLNTAQAAEVLGIAKQTMAIWRSTKPDYLPWVKVGSRVLYDRSDLEAFIAKRKRQSAARRMAE